jgi:hypothetical protein
MTVVDGNDITAGVLVVIGLVIFALNVRTAFVCEARDRFVHIWYAVSGVGISFAFALAIYDSFMGGAGLVPPEIGRPSVIMLAGSVMIASILHYRRGRC